MPIIKGEKLSKFDPSRFGDLRFEVDAAVYSDWKRDTVDEAKKRAIYTSKTYDDFRQLVAGCTLKPIHRKDFDAPPKAQDVNRYCKSGDPDWSSHVKTGTANSSGAGSAGSGCSSYTSVTLLEKQFRRCENEQTKEKLLSELYEGDEALSIFKGYPVEPEFLEDILRTLIASRKALVAGGAGEKEDGENEGRKRFDDVRMDGFTKALANQCEDRLKFCFNFLTDDTRHEFKTHFPELRSILE